MRFEVLDRARDLADAEATITTNLLGPIRLINALIDHLVKQPDAAIVNVTSGLAFVPLVTTPTYNATKAAIHSYTIAMRRGAERAGGGDRTRAARRADRAHARPGEPPGLSAARMSSRMR